MAASARRRCSEHPWRHEYVLTAMGEDLSPVLAGLAGAVSRA
ncbi:winged helix-turn-helix transcriptional regulator [Streptomyces sp. NPDC008061]